MLWACIYLPHLEIDSVLRRHPSSDEPLALIGGTPQRRELISVNRAAANAGLHPGQRLAGAHALLNKFAIVEHDPTAALRWQQFLAAWAYQFSSQVYAGWPNCIVLEAKGSFSIIGPWPQFEAQLREELTALKFRHRIALAPTPSAARILSGVQDGIGILESAHLHLTLGRVPVRRAYLPNEAGPRLHKMGLRHLRQVFALPRDSLRRRFGIELLTHLDQMLGNAPHLLEYYAPPDYFDFRIELNYEIAHHQALLFPVRRMTADLATYLTGRDGGVLQFVLQLEHEEFKATDVVVGLLSAERDPGMLFELTKNRLERVSIPAPVIALRLIAKHLPPFIPAGVDLFDERPANAVPWSQLRERLRARLGNDAVYQLGITCDPRPEHAWQREDGNPAASMRRANARPTWLLKRPIPLRDTDITILEGPERLESGWWDGGDARRDYYRLQTSRGQQAWAFTPVGEQGPWMLHGWFA